MRHEEIVKLNISEQKMGVTKSSLCSETHTEGERESMSHYEVEQQESECDEWTTEKEIYWIKSISFTLWEFFFSLVLTDIRL